jgi:perosamine synthetase
MIPYAHQSIDDDDIAAVVGVLKGDWLTQGPTVDEFEHRLSSLADAQFCVAFANGTAALHAAAWVSGLGPGDIVAVPALTFIATLNAARYVGASPVIVDIESETLNLDVEQVPADAAGVIAVHFAGLPVDLRTLTRRPRVVIEDAAHALGATTPYGPVGNCAYSDLCCFSFHPVKAITTGEGGAVTTNDPSLAERLRLFRSHGIRRTPDRGEWAYDVSSVGFNYRLTDIQAALGTSQLGKLARFIQRRNDLAERYRRALAGTPVLLPPEPLSGFTHAYHLFPVRVRDRTRVYDELRKAGVAAQVHYVPLHHHSDLTAIRRIGPLEATDHAYEGLLSLPLYPGLSDAEQDQVVTALRQSVS